MPKPVQPVQTTRKLLIGFIKAPGVREALQWLAFFAAAYVIVILILLALAGRYEI